MTRFLPLLLGLSSLSLLACDDGPGGTGGASSSTTGSGTTTGSASTSSTSSTGSASSSTGGPDPVGECNVNEDCAPGFCVAFMGLKVCEMPVEEATTCSAPGLDECCTTAECSMFEKCVAAPATPTCGGAPPPEHNVCASDECQTNNDCASGICVPAGVAGNKVNRCMESACAGTMCASNPSLPCGFVREPCCNTVAGFYCVDGCTKNEDCMDGYCVIDPVTKASRCTSGSPACPP